MLSRVGYYCIAGVLTTDLESHATLTSLMANIYDRSQTDSTLQQFDAASCLLHIMRCTLEEAGMELIV